MAPLPCSPVSNSTASESHSFPASEESDDSLTTPRPGPTDPAQRTVANLSKPSVPTYSSSPESPKTGGSPRRSSPLDVQVDGQRRYPYTYGSSSKADPQAGADSRPRGPQRQLSVTFTQQSVDPKMEGKGSYSGYHVDRRPSPTVSPHGLARDRMHDEIENSSADERTAMFPRDRIAGGGKSAYGAVSGNEDDAQDVARGYEGAAEEDESGSRRRKGSSVKIKGKNADAPARMADPVQQVGDDGKSEEKEGWFKKLVQKYGSVELENKGSVARDHLALERTFLAWLRTSLSFASIGIAVTQLFRLNTSLSDPNTSAQSTSTDSPKMLPVHQQVSTLPSDAARLRHVGKPLGATFLGISILILLLGFHRYFESQHYVIRGKFPASRGTIILVSLVAFALIVASLIVVIAVAPSAFQTST